MATREQAFVNYALANGGVVTAGRYASMLGFEAFEPTGLYQYSFAYAIGNLGDASVLPLYAQGVKYTIEGRHYILRYLDPGQAFDLGSIALVASEGDARMLLKLLVASTSAMAFSVPRWCL